MSDEERAINTADKSQQIDFATTILSRFDLIFLVKDEHNEARDRASPYAMI